MAMFMMLFQLLTPVIARPLSPEQEKQLHTRLKHSCVEPGKAVLTPGMLKADDVIEHVQMQFKVVGEMGAAPRYEVRDNLNVISLCDLQFFLVCQRLMDRPTAVLGPNLSSQTRRLSVRSLLVFNERLPMAIEAWITCSLPVWVLVVINCLPNSYPVPFSVSVHGDEDLGFAALAAASGNWARCAQLQRALMWGPFLPNFRLHQLQLLCNLWQSGRVAIRVGVNTTESKTGQAPHHVMLPNF